MPLGCLGKIAVGTRGLGVAFGYCNSLVMDLRVFAVELLGELLSLFFVEVPRSLSRAAIYQRVPLNDERSCHDGCYSPAGARQH